MFLEYIMAFELTHGKARTATKTVEDLEREIFESDSDSDDLFSFLKVNKTSSIDAAIQLAADLFVLDRQAAKISTLEIPDVEEVSGEVLGTDEASKDSKPSPRNGTTNRFKTQLSSEEMELLK